MTSSMSPEESQERRRLEFGAPSAGDSELLLLLRLSTGPLSRARIPLHLLVGGTMVRGRIASPEDFGSHLDTSLRTIVEQTTANGDHDPGQAMLEFLGDSYFRRRAEERRTESQRTDVTLEQREEQNEKIDRAMEEADGALIDADDLPEGMPAGTMRDAVYHLTSDPVLTLTDAEVLVGADWVGVEMLRVLVRQVGAWWVGQSSERPRPTA